MTAFDDLARAAERFWQKIHREGLCPHRDGMAWTECEQLADALFTADHPVDIPIEVAS